jgi:hypothetical protein
MRLLANKLLGPLGYEVRRCRDGGKPARAEQATSFRWNVQNARRLAYFHSLLRQIQSVPGDIVECGVYSGYTLYAQAVFLEALSPRRHIYGFDSFEGLPAASAEDAPQLRPESKVEGRFANSKEAVVARLLAHGLPADFVDRQIHLIEGWFSETLPDFDRPIALLHVDVDLYRSYLDVLENLYPRVSRGGIVAFDEYHDPLWVGATRAIHEYFGDDVEIRESDILPGKYYLVKE